MALTRVAAGAAVGAVGLEALLVEAALDFLDLGERRRALAAGELLQKGGSPPMRSPRCTSASV